MFEDLRKHLSSILDRLRGQGRLTEENIQDTLREIRIALLEADVALPIVREFIKSIQEKAHGKLILKSLTPGQTLIKLVNDELIRIMGQANNTLNLTTQPPAVILIVGLQGSGKTTSTVKLARFLKERRKKKVLVVSCDIYRPAAIKQLQMLANEVSVEFYPSKDSDKPFDIAVRALDIANKAFFDVLIVDTAGRLHIDNFMMNEVKQLHMILKPVETLFVVDSMMGQEAANTAKAFDDILSLTGIILAKTDGDARGGAALSIRYITGKPIKFLGIGEKTDALEAFYPDRLVSRILGMGDVVSLVEEVSLNINRTKIQELTKKVSKGKIFTLEDFREQILQILRMGGISKMLDRIPMKDKIPKNFNQEINEKNILRIVAIINSMTQKEREYPVIIKGSRKKRIARGAGVQVQDINRLLKQFLQMQKLMKGKGITTILANLGKNNFSSKRNRGFPF